MRIAIVGYGKMGKVIEEIAVSRGHEIVLKINSSNRDQFTKVAISKADVAIEFTHPEAGESNVLFCLENGVSTVSGTTGWNESLHNAVSMANDKKVGFLHASNFSVGVNLFFALNKKLAAMMKNYSEYKAEVEEIHHTSKKDSPSGTAITIANGIIENHQYSQWVNQSSSQPNILPIISRRIDPAPGTHIVKYSSDIDTIAISHEAHSRRGFAFGAVLAAEWIHGKSGSYTMNDVLDI